MSYSNYQEKLAPFSFRYAQDLLRYRHLCWNLVGSDLRARFRRSYLGVLWAVIQPLAFSLIVAGVWGSVFKESSYFTFAIYVFSGMIVWEYFLTSVTVSLDALSNAQGYLKQARIPFFIFQVRVPLSAMVILGFALIGLVGLMIVLQKFPPVGFHLLLVPVHLVLLLLFVTPVSLLFSIVGAHFRDARYIVMLAFQALFFLSPVMLGREILAQPSLKFLEFLNPAVPMIDMLRDPLVYGRGWEMQDFLVLMAWTAATWCAALIASAAAGRRLVFAL